MLLPWVFVCAVAALLCGGISLRINNVYAHIVCMTTSIILVFTGIIISWATRSAATDRDHTAVGTAAFTLMLLQSLTGSFFSRENATARMHFAAAVVLVALVVYQSATGAQMSSVAVSHVIIGMIEVCTVLAASYVSKQHDARARMRVYFEPDAWIKWPVLAAVGTAFACAIVAAHAVLENGASSSYIALVCLFYCTEILWAWLPNNLCTANGPDTEMAVLLAAAILWTAVVEEAYQLDVPPWCLYLHVPMAMNVWTNDICLYYYLGHDRANK